MRRVRVLRAHPRRGAGAVVSGVDRKSRRAMLAAIALADAPAPVGVRMPESGPAAGILSIDVESQADGLAWLQHLGIEWSMFDNETDGRRYVIQACHVWGGWSLQVGIPSVLIADDPIADDGTRAQLAVLAAAPSEAARQVRAGGGE